MTKTRSDLKLADTIHAISRTPHHPPIQSEFLNRRLIEAIIVSGAVQHDRVILRIAFLRGPRFLAAPPSRC